MENNEKSPADMLLEAMNKSSGGEEELLKVASKYSLQLSGVQIRGLLLLKIVKKICSKEDQERIDEFTKDYLMYKEYNGSDRFVMAALQEISLKKFISSIGINAIKQL